MSHFPVVAAKQNSLAYKRASVPTAGYVSFVGEVSASGNDAHELVTTGAVTLTTSFLDVGGFTGVADVYVAGFRFLNVTLPQGQAVPFAQLRFVAGSGNSKGCLLRIWAEDADNSGIFTTATGNITGRTKTTAFVDWDVPIWVTDKDDAGTLSPNLGSLVQEVIDRPGWVSGNALTFIIGTSPDIVDTEFPRRKPRAFDSGLPSPARLSINTTEGLPDPDPSPTGDFSDGYDLYGLEGNAAFNPSVPTLKDGTAFTPEMETLYAAFLTPFLSNSSHSYHNVNVFGVANTYEQARRGQICQLPAMCAFRMTGDLRILDRMVYGYNLMKSNLTNGWGAYNVATLNARSVQWASPGVTRDGRTMTGNPWGTHRSIKWLTGSTDYRYATDIHTFDEGKSRALMAEFTWALHINRAKTSPGGYNYDTLADEWAGIMGGTDGARTSWWWAWSGEGSADWALQNYRGVNSNPAHSWSSRPAAGTWPIYWNDEGHTAYNNPDLNRYLGLLGKYGDQAGSPLAITGVDAAIASGNETALVTQGYWVNCVDSHGFPSILTRGSLGPTSSRYAEPLRSTYSGYAATAAIASFMTGAYPTVYSVSNMRALSRAYADMFNSNETGVTVGRLGGNTDHCGHGLGLAAGVDSTTTVCVQAYAGMLVFADETETDGDRLWNCATAAHTASGGGYGAGSNMHALPALQFVKRAFDEVGALVEE